jgi:hypothetical protein
MRSAMRMLLRTKRAGVRTIAPRDVPWRMLSGDVSAAGAEAAQVAGSTTVVVATAQLHIAGAAQAAVLDTP